MSVLTDMALALGCDLDAPMQPAPEILRRYEQLSRQKPRYRWNYQHQYWVGPFIRLRRDRYAP